MTCRARCGAMGGKCGRDLCRQKRPGHHVRRRRTKRQRRVVQHGQAGQRLQVRVAAVWQGRIGKEDHRVQVPGGDQCAQLLVAAAPERFFLPPYVGPKGWIGIRLDTPGGPDWDEVAFNLERSHALILAKGARPRRKAD